MICIETGDKQAGTRCLLIAVQLIRNLERKDILTGCILCSASRMVVSQTEEVLALTFADFLLKVFWPSWQPCPAN